MLKSDAEIQAAVWTGASGLMNQIVEVSPYKYTPGFDGAMRALSVAAFQIGTAYLRLANGKNPITNEPWETDAQS